MSSVRSLAALLVFAALLPLQAGAPQPGMNSSFQSPDGSFTVPVPAGWRAQTAENFSFLVPEDGSEERILLVSGPASASSIQELAQQAAQLAAQSFHLRVTGTPVMDAARGRVEIQYVGQTQSGTVSAWNGIWLRDGAYYAVLSLATQERAQAVEAQARIVFSNMRTAKLAENSGLARAIVGRWEYYYASRGGGGSSSYSTSVSKILVFYPDGRFSYTGGVGADSGIPSGTRTSVNSDGSITGRYTVTGNSLTAHYDNGQTATFQIQMKGSTGLLINGMLFTR